MKARLLVPFLVLAAAGPSWAAQPAAGDGAAGATPPAIASAAPLSGLDRVNYNALLELDRQADQTMEQGEKRALLRRFMDESRDFIAKHPEQLELWQFRAEAALILDDIAAGFEAGQKLLAGGAADSSDPDLQHLMVQLQLRGWLDEAGVRRRIQGFVYTPGKDHVLALPHEASLDLAWIAPGRFTLGSARTEPGRDKNEGPTTSVAITRGFWLGKTPVTQGQYRAVMEANPSHFADAGDEAPVENVSWDDAMEFCRKLNAEERAAGHLPDDYAYTLPTEAQWEYACRAGTTGPRYGPDLAALAWYGDNSGGSTHPVGQKAPNAWGLFDMLGNVGEWCSDWYGVYHGGAASDPAGPATGVQRVIRGGSARDKAGNIRSAFRGYVAPDHVNVFLGFRLALESVR